MTAGSQLTLCGHCRLRPADSEQRERVWSLLRGLLETYSHLREEDQSFAVEVPCPGVSVTFGASQGCETVWSPGLGTSGQLPGAVEAQTSAWLGLVVLSSLRPRPSPRLWSD